MIIICIAVRLKSKRCPKKALASLAGEPMLIRQVERLMLAGRKIVVCTSDLPSDNPIETLCRWHDIEYYRGSATDVMARFLGAAHFYRAEHIVRVTGDNPLTDPGLIQRMTNEHIKGGFNYTRVKGPPKGTKPEIIRVSALERLHRQIPNPHYSEYMTPMLESMDCICSLELRGEGCDPEMRLTVDYPEDLARVRQIYNHFNGNPPLLPELTVWVRENLTDYYETGLVES